MNKYDDIIIGFGKGGKTLAAKLAGIGKRVALVEKDADMYGGTCINVGCIPSKSLVKSSETAYKHSKFNFEQKAEYYSNAIKEKRQLTKMLRDKNYAKLDSLANVDIYNGKASFISNKIIKVDMENSSIELEGSNFYINTGGTPVMPDIEGINNKFVYTSDRLMELEQLPKKLIIIGGGYIGMEFASIYSGFGSEVTVLQTGDKILKKEDRDIADAVKTALENKGVIFELGIKIKRLAEEESCVKVIIERDGREEALEAQAVLTATGRKPNTKDLNAQSAGGELDDRGAVIVDENLKTTASNIWAMGDAKGGLQFTYVSLDDFRIIWSQLNNGDYNKAKRKEVPYSMFITPPYSRVGMNEEEAQKSGKNIKVMKLLVSAIPKAQVLKKTEGILKAIVDRDTDRILGAMLLCEESYEMINIVKLAMDMDAPYQVLRDQIYTHPTMSEAFNDLFSL